jgi:hypothetical protein
MHLHAFSCLQLQKDPAQLGQLRGVVGRAAHLRRQLVDGLRRDGAVLVAHLGVLLLLEDVHRLDLVHGLAARDYDRVEVIEQLIIQALILVLVLLFELLRSVEVVDGQARGVARRRPQVRPALAVLVAHELVLALLNPPKCTGIHNNASECITGRMQHIQNAPS